MSWFRIDDGFTDHPKVIALRASKQWKGAVCLWTMAGSHCSRHLTDGRVTLPVLAHLGGTTQEADALVAAGLWTKVDGGYQFHEWAERNPTKAKVLAARAKDAARKKPGGPDGFQMESDRNPAGVRADGLTPSASPVPSRPVPTQPDPSTPGPTEESAEAGASGPPEPQGPTDAERVAELSARYPAPLVASARAACARSRKRGEMADSVWRGTLERLDAFTVDVVVRSMTKFIEKHADGSKDEAYLVGIARNETDRGARTGAAGRPMPAASHYADSETPEDETSQLSMSVTDEDRARLARLAGRAAHG